MGYDAEKLQQFYKGIKVEFALMSAVSKNGELKSINGKYVPIKNLNIIPKLSEKEALAYALKNIGATKYMWEIPANEQIFKLEKIDSLTNYYPKGELVIIEKDMFTAITKPVLAYKFDIYALSPFSRSNIYVDAVTGEIIFINSILRDVDGVATTRYSGLRTIKTELSSGQYRLRDNTRGNGIYTFNANHTLFNSNGSVNLSGSTDYTDNDNNWTETEYNNANKDNAALDAHWGAEMTYDYFFNKFGRNSIDDNGYRLNNYVHVSTNWENARWDGSQMLYGDGDIKFNVLTSLDVIAHEIGHGLDQFTANLIYEREQGALNEGLSDIWGSMIEFYAAPEKETYWIGEDISLLSFALRSMLNPNSRNQPDTYNSGNYWANTNCGTPSLNNDYCGVHTNSGVLSYWFYLLAEGDIGTNDIGNNYNISGLGKDKAANIVYRAETVYFGSTTNFQEARNLTILAAEDLYGVNSLEAVTVNNAWYAVGIGNLIAGQLQGDNSTCYNINTIFTLTNFTNQPVNWVVSSNLQIVNSDNTSIIVRAGSNATRGAGFIIANISGQLITRDVWVGEPNPPSILSGPSIVAYGAIVNYQSDMAQGASSYNWYLPYPYEINSTVVVDPVKWRILGGETTRYLRTLVGPNDGLIQVMGLNKCGTGGAKIMSVLVSASGGGVKPGGGNMPLNGITSGTASDILIYPTQLIQKLLLTLIVNLTTPM